MTGGTISGNSAEGGGGVDVYKGTFAKTGGTIYGDNNNTHMSGSTENTALNGQGHAVQLRTDDNTKTRGATLETDDDLSSSDLSTNWDS